MSIHKIDGVTIDADTIDSKNAELAANQVPVLDADAKLPLANLADAVCSETEADSKIAAIPSDPIAATPGLRTLGAGAQQAAAGNHTHTLVEDTSAEAEATTNTSTPTGYEASLAVPGLTEVDLVTTTPTFAAGSLAFGAACLKVRVNNVDVKLRFYMGGAQQEEHTFGSAAAGYNVIMTAFKAMVGAQVVKVAAYNYNASEKNVIGWSQTNAEKASWMIAVGSVKV